MRQGGILVLGNAETTGHVEGRFEAVAKKERIYRHIGRNRPGEFGLAMTDGTRLRGPPGHRRAPSQEAALADLGRRTAAGDICTGGHTDQPVGTSAFSCSDRPTATCACASGRPTHDLLAMARPGMRTKLRSAIQQAIHAQQAGGDPRRPHGARRQRAFIQRRSAAGGERRRGAAAGLLRRRAEPGTGTAVVRRTGRTPQVAELERELDVTRTELQGAIHDLELSNEEQKAINEEALSVNEEFQSTNEELMTSKEELQSLNEELTALNGQLQETLEQQRTTSDDLQNVLYSTDVATLFLDIDLKIRFFTPATKSLFALIQSDVGRPLADFRSLVADGALLSDAQAVLQHRTPIEHEIEAPNGIWFRRRILPYRTHGGGVEGVVMTFTEITERKQVARALEAAKQQAELASVAKSRFLAAASHDLRQPLQTLSLLQGLLAKTVQGDREKKLLARLDETLGAMSGMLNTLLDINQIEAGIVHADNVIFPIGDLLNRLRDEFSYHAQAKGLALHVVPCGRRVRSDPRLLEQMIRNLLSNAIKYTQRGKVLLGCRRTEPACSASRYGIPGSAFRRRSCSRSSRNTIRSTMRPANAASVSGSVCRSCSAWPLCWAIT